MRSPYGLQIIENCVTCPHKESRLFCNLAPAALQRLSEITSSATYPKGATLFVEGQPARGVFILCAGHVKLSTSSSDGRTLILRISEPGDLLGLAGHDFRAAIRSDGGRDRAHAGQFHQPC